MPLAAHRKGLKRLPLSVIATKIDGFFMIGDIGEPGMVG